MANSSKSARALIEGRAVLVVIDIQASTFIDASEVRADFDELAMPSPFSKTYPARPALTRHCRKGKAHVTLQITHLWRVQFDRIRLSISQAKAAFVRHKAVRRQDEFN